MKTRKENLKLLIDSLEECSSINSLPNDTTIELFSDYYQDNDLFKGWCLAKTGYMLLYSEFVHDEEIFCIVLTSVDENEILCEIDFDTLDDALRILSPYVTIQDA